MSHLIDRALQISHLVDQIRRLLAGQTPDIQGAVLADLCAIWLAGHPPQVRTAMLDFQCRTIKKLIPVNERILFGTAGHPNQETP